MKQLAALLILVVAACSVRADERVVEGKQGMVVSVSAPASAIGVDILKKGGTAVDAAVAVAFALAVTYPAAGNIGGGGFMMVHPAKGDPVCIEYRETAPAAAAKDMYRKTTSYLGLRVVGVPGTVRGMALAHERYGKLAWKDVVLPAVKLAEEGFLIDAQLAGSLNRVVADSADFPELQRVFGKNGKPDWQAGDRLIQKDLGKSLRLIAEQGPDAFYTGAIADLLVKEMKSGDGLITKEDLKNYQAKVRQPIHGTFRGYDVYGPPPPSSGGIVLIEMLNMLENFPLKKMGRWSPETVHLIIESMRRAYCDRARHLGDADFVKIPEYLTSKKYARGLALTISPTKATRSLDIAKDIPIMPEGDSTTHFSVIDKAGNAVSNTYTLERSYGSRVVVRGAGFLLNNEMMDFNWLPGVTDDRGLIGTLPNQIAPGKRMLSSQTPVIVAKGGKVFLVTGSPGGRTIINTVLGNVLNVLEFDMDVGEAVDTPRLHHQWFPDAARLEQTGKHPELVRKLRKMGHSIEANDKQGDAHSILVDPKTGVYRGAADQRISGAARGY